MIKIIVYLKDGRTLSGSYPWAEALARLEFAQALPDYVCFDIVGAV